MRSLIDKLAGLAVIAAALSAIRTRSPTRPVVARASERPHPPAPPRSAKGLVLALRDAVAEDQVGTLAAAMTYYAFLAAFPALIAIVSVYGLVSSPAEVADQVRELSSLLPGDSAAELVSGQLEEIVSSSRSGLGIGLAISLVGLLWSVSSGITALIRGINLAFDETESRSFLQLRLLAIGLTVGLVLFVVAAVFVITGLPATLRNLGWTDQSVAWVSGLRWVALVAAAAGALTLFYRVAPNRRRPPRRWFSTGALVAAGLWLVASALLNVYVSNFGSYNETYGTLAGVIVLMLWLYVSSFIVLVGAEYDAITRVTREPSVRAGSPTT